MEEFKNKTKQYESNIKNKSLMIQIKTTIPVIFDATTLKTGYGIIQLNNWIETTNGFIAETEKFALNDGVMTAIPGQQKSVTISIDQYNFLVEAIKPFIPEGLTPFEEREFIKSQAFLLFVKNDRLPSDETKCIWGLQPSQFELVE